MEKYKPRIIDDILKRKLKGKGAVLIEGPKWCGKTTSAKQIAKSVLLMANPTDEKQNIILADTNPQLLLQGDVPRLIDEWQVAPKLWDAIRYEVDERSEEGQFLLTGSAVPCNMDEITHTGTGRIARILMRPMSLFESGESTGEVSLQELFNNPSLISGTNPNNFSKIAFLTCRGGWPRSIFMEDEIALDQAFDYYDAIVNADISRVDDIKKNPERVKLLLKSYARNQGQQVSNEFLRKDMIANDSESLNRDTVLSYVNALKKIFVIEEVPAWNPNLRSKTAVASSYTRYFIDPSIATAALGIGPKDLENDLNTFGFLFETLCVRDLRIYASALNGDIYHYRDNRNLECDCVVHLRNGTYGLIEVKIGGDKLIEEGAASLKKLVNKIDTEKMKEPSFLMVLVGTGTNPYKREDGIFVVPIGCLKN